MKKLLLFFGIILLSGKAYNQDIIFKTNGDEIKSKVIEVAENVIRYKNYTNLNGPVYVLSITSIFMIKYENGEKEVFRQQPTTAIRSSGAPENTTKPKDTGSAKNEKNSFFKYHQDKYFALATGVGNSYGGIGLRAQARFGGSVGFGIHAGAGWYPGIEYESCFAFAGGVKFFPYKGIYINAQFGVLGKQLAFSYVYDPYYGYSYDYYNQVMYGPSILTGVDWIFGSHFGFNAAGGISIITNGYMSGEILPALDLGFVYKF
jgi:hypothetical protein